MSNDNMEERALFEKVRLGRVAESLGGVCYKFESIIRNHLRKAGADGLAGDICQEVFARVCSGKCSYSGTGDVASFLCGVARNILREQLSARRLRACPVEQMENIGGYTSSTALVEALEVVEVRQILRVATAELPQKSRQAIELVHVDGIRASKAAKLIGCDFKVFRDRLDYGYTCLRKG